MRRTPSYSLGHSRKPRENVRNVFLNRLFKERCEFEGGASPHSGKKSKPQSRWSYHSVKYKPKKFLPKPIYEVSVDEESDFFEDALEELYEPVKASTESIKIKLRQKNGIVAEVSDPVSGQKTLEFTKEQLAKDNLEFVYEPKPGFQPKFAVLLGGSTIYMINKTKADLERTKTDVAIQTSMVFNEFESDTQQNTLLIETTGKQFSFDELPYDKESFKTSLFSLDTFNYIKPPVKLTAFKDFSKDSFTENSHPNLLATRLRAKSFANLINYDKCYFSPHTTSLVSSIPEDEVFHYKPLSPLRKFSLKRTMPPSIKTIAPIIEKSKIKNGVKKTIYVNEEMINHLTDVSDVYLTEILHKTIEPYMDEEEIKKISNPNALFFIENSDPSSSENIKEDLREIKENHGLKELPDKTSESKDEITTTESLETIENSNAASDSNCSKEGFAIIDSDKPTLEEDTTRSEVVTDNLVVDVKDSVPNKNQQDKNVSTRHSSVECLSVKENLDLRQSRSLESLSKMTDCDNLLLNSKINYEVPKADEAKVEETKVIVLDKLPTPMELSVVISSKSKYDFKTDKFINQTVSNSIVQSTSSYYHVSSSSSKNKNDSRPRTCNSSKKEGSRERPMTSVSEALKDVETALKPLQDQLKEIRTKMASLNNHGYNPYEDLPAIPKAEKPPFPVNKDLLPPKYFFDQSHLKVPAKASCERLDEKISFSKPRRHEAMSIWTDPEDIIGHSSPSVNFPSIGVKKTF